MCEKGEVCMTPPLSRQRSGQSSASSADSPRVKARTAHFDRHHTTVFTGAPRVVAGPSAVLLGNVDNDPNGDMEVAIGGMDGTLTVFKGGQFTGPPFLSATGLGTVTALGLGTLLLGHNDSLQLIACTMEGVCHIFDIRWDSSFKAHDTYTSIILPLWSVPCPQNVTACCIADVNGDDRQEVVVSTSDGGLYVLSVEVNSGHEDEQQGAQDGGAERGGHETLGGTSSAANSSFNSVMYSSSSAEQSVVGLTAAALENVASAQWLSREDDASAAASKEAASAASAGNWADSLKTDSRRKELKSGSNEPDCVGTGGGTHGQDHPVGADSKPAIQVSRTSAWSHMAGASGPPAPRAPLNPHLKTLLELRASGEVTSLSVFSCPGLSSSPRNVVTPAAASSSTGALSHLDVQDAAAGRPHWGTLSPASDETCEGAQHASRRGAGGSAKRSIFEWDGAAGGVGRQESSSGSGVYAAVGLKEGTMQVMRLSARRSGSDHLELVAGAGRLRLSGAAVACFGAADSAGGDGGGSTASGVGKSSHDVHNPALSFSPAFSGEEGRHERYNSSVPCGESSARHENACHGFDKETGAFRLKLDAASSESAAATAEEQNGIVGPDRGIGGGGVVLEADDWWVPVEIQGDIPLSLNGWSGGGLVVGLTESTRLRKPTEKAVSATPTGAGTPISHTFSGHSTGSAGRRGGVSGTRGGVEDDCVRVPEGMSFGVCTEDGRVCCCRVVSTAVGRPAWTTTWARQTEECFFALQRISYPTGSGQLGHGQEEKETLLVACSWGGTTFLFDAEGNRCITFAPGPSLNVTAFAAGDVTTSSGNTEACLVYVTDGGEVLAFHSLFNQAGPMAPPQFLSTLVDNGAMDTLYDLVNSLWKRLKRRSNQADLLFSAPTPSRPPPSSTATPPTTTTATITTEQDGRADGPRVHHEMDLSGRDSPAPKPEVDPTASRVSQTNTIEEDAGKYLQDDKENSVAGSSLCFSDDILARAVLCQAGAAYAYGVSRKEKRWVSGAVEGAGGKGGESGAQAAERRILSGVTVRQGALAAERLLKELKAWRHGQARGQDLTLKHYPCLRGTLEVLSLYGSGARQASLRTALKESMSSSTPDGYASPGIL